jgi:hypothetical protein
LVDEFWVVVFVGPTPVRRRRSVIAVVRPFERWVAARVTGDDG